MSEQDRYKWWQDALAGNVGAIHEGEPQSGFFRRKVADGSMVGIAIWYDGDKPVALVSGKPANPNTAWISGAKNPVSEEFYREWESNGVWPDDHKIVAPSASPGSNEPTDEAEMLRDQIESARAGAADYAKVESDEQAAKAQSLRSRLLELSRNADKRRTELKKPFLEGGKAVDTKWQPLVNAAKEVADAIAKSMSAWETKKAKAAAEAQRQTDEERRRREDEARAAEQAGKPAPAPVLDLEPVPTPPPTTRIKGGYGRAAAVKVVNVVTAVTDFDALVQRYRPAVLVLVTERAQKDIDAGFEVPGVTVEERRKVA